MTAGRTTARRPGEPKPDLIGYRVVHRAMVVDLDRLATAAAELAEHFDRARFNALRYYHRIVAHEIANHHTVEDDHVWPLLVALDCERAALVKLTDDHNVLDPLLHRADELLEHPRPGPELAATLREIAGLLVRHIADEERDIFPMIEQLVTIEDYQKLQQHFQSNFPPRMLPFLVVWAFRHATPEEYAAMMATTPTPFRIMHRMYRARFIAREKLLFR